MANQDMLFPILPRPHPPVNPHDIDHRHEVEKVDKKPPTEIVHDDQSSSHSEHSEQQKHQQPDDELDVDEKAKNDDDQHPEHIDLFV